MPRPLFDAIDADRTLIGGGVADTVMNVNPATMPARTLAGVILEELDSGALLVSIQRALNLWREKTVWQQLQYTAGERDFSWQCNASQYLQLYNSGPRTS
jgi:starch synthase